MKTLRARTRKWIARNPTPVRYALFGCAVASLVVGAVLIYYYVSFSRIIDARLSGERERSLPRIYARPMQLRRGETLTEQELIARLNDLGYAQRPAAQAPGEFAIARNTVLITPRSGELSGRVVRATFPAPPPVRRATTPPPPPRGIIALDVISAGKPGTVSSAVLDRPLLTALMTSGAREKRRRVALDVIPKRM